MKRLYRNHQWISIPDNNGISYFGISSFLKNYCTRLKRIDYE